MNTNRLRFDRFVLTFRKINWMMAFEGQPVRSARQMLSHPQPDSQRFLSQALLWLLVSRGPSQHKLGWDRSSHGRRQVSVVHSQAGGLFLPLHLLENLALLPISTWQSPR